MRPERRTSPHADAPRTRGARSSPLGANPVMLLAGGDGGEPSNVILRGAIDGAHLYRFGEILDQAVRLPSRTIEIDLTGLDNWSLIAQAMVLSTARRLTVRGGRLVLHGPSQRLRDASTLMRIFDRLPTRDSGPGPFTRADRGT